MKSFRNFLLEFRQTKKETNNSPNEIVNIENREKSLDGKERDYTEHHVVWTANNKGYFIHKDKIHKAFGGTSDIGLKIGDLINPDEHQLFYSE